MHIYKDKHCHISYLEQKKIIYLKWHQKPNESQLIKVYNKGIDAAIKFEARGWITDNSIGFHLDLSMQRALAELSVSRLPETSVVRFARVIPLDVFQELVTHKITNTINEQSYCKIEVEVFNDLQDASDWVTNTARKLASAC